MRQWDMHDRAQRKGVYEQLLQGGSPEEMIRWIDGPLLVEACSGGLDLTGRGARSVEVADCDRAGTNPPGHRADPEPRGRLVHGGSVGPRTRRRDAKEGTGSEGAAGAVRPDAFRPAAASADGGRRRNETGNDRRQGCRTARHSVGYVAPPLRTGHVER